MSKRPLSDRTVIVAKRTGQKCIGKKLRTLSLVQEWLYARNATVVVAHVRDTCVCCHVDYVVALDALIPASVHSLWSSNTFFNSLCFTILSGLRLSLLLVQLFLPHFLLPLNFLWICLETLWTAIFFSDDLLRLSLLVEGVNDCLLPNCHDCEAYLTRLRDNKRFRNFLQVFWGK